MTIEDRVRRMLAEAVAAEPAPSGAPLDRALRYRRRRPLRLAAVAVALLLATAGVAVGVRAIGTEPVPLPTAPVAPAGWKTFRSVALYNLEFRYPPDWAVQGQGGIVATPGHPAGTDRSRPAAARPFGIGVGLSPDYYLFVVQNGVQVTRGRLPDGRAFIRWTSAQAGARSVSYAIDWGQYCLSPGRECGAKSINVSIQASGQALLDRYGQAAEQIVRTFRPARPTAPSTGDPTRPSCQPNQWRPVFSLRNKATIGGPAGWVISGDVRSLGGPPCHLRTTLRLTVERAGGTPVAMPGTPSPFPIEADLPENGGVAGEVPRSAAMWFWEWDNWCRQTLPGARVRVTADTGASTTRSLPPRSIQDPRFPCRPDAPWRIVPLP